MLIGELSRRTDVHPHQLRYYESQGLLAPRRSAGGYREYTEDAVLIVTQIRQLLAAGLSTQEIRFLQPCVTGAAPDLEPCPEALTTLRARLGGLDAQIETLGRSRRALQEHIEATERRMPDRSRECEPSAVGSSG
ncbi:MULTISPECIES: MerR family transcriptional regulator [Actinoalloteichus]|uniref:Transcriptional regulator n=1 Tax=Actinoalloteichus fjordicus TaxID=1612552 RepID=A0AAC9PRV8_9PSEU|nr:MULTISPECIES: MerR family transcriptional regulator [Actinoalloteichus]APU14824.1 putative transcriptional regulator [Actinoalloteichus fjordicus]APU20793.1 putative transcriptional regulator [Actinoalloteichus sp. GBA129-24]